jgi:membrane protein YdbS with pleckstrin-like domain
MKCPKCAAEVADNAAFCPQCGASLKAAASVASAQPAAKRGRAIDEPERDLWSGAYSPKAMLGVWAVLALLSLVGLAIGFLQLSGSAQWSALLAVIVLAWLAGAMVLVYRRLSVRYRLTSQRLYHEKGVLRRTIDRIELIRMDDITCEQGPVERALGIGSIRVKSTDRSDPEFWIYGVEDVRNVASTIDQARRAEQVRRNVFIEMGAANG